MTATELTEYAHLINLWNCTELMTKEQNKRLTELDKMTINDKPQTAEDLLKLALGTKADYEADWRKAEKAYREYPSAATFADLHAARQALRRQTN